MNAIKDAKDKVLTHSCP